MNGGRGEAAAGAGRAATDRGQVLLIAGLALAVTFVAIALVLNAVIYTENLATRDQGPGTAAVSASAAAESAVSGAIARINREGPADHDAAVADLEAAAAGWDGLAARQAAADGASVSLSLTSADVENGTQIRQTDASRNFTAADDPPYATDWTLVSGAPSYRSFAMTVNRADLHEGSLDDPANLTDDGFNVTVDDGTDAWRIYVVRNASEGVVVFAEAPGESVSGAVTDYCAVDAQQVTVNLTARTVGGADCPDLAAPTFSGDLSVSYANADNVTGTYRLVVAKASVDDSNYHAAGSGSPFTEPAIYAASPTVRYEDGEVTYERTRRVHPGNETA